MTWSLPIWLTSLYHTGQNRTYDPLVITPIPHVHSLKLTAIKTVDWTTRWFVGFTAFYAKQHVQNVYKCKASTIFIMWYRQNWNSFISISRLPINNLFQLWFRLLDLLSSQVIMKRIFCYIYIYMYMCTRIFIFFSGSRFDTKYFVLPYSKEFRPWINHA